MNTFTIPIELCDLNTYINAERSNRHIGASIKKKNTEAVMLFCKQLDLDFTKQYDIIADWFTKDKRKDSDNIFFSMKFILDGVVKSGRLLGDGYKQIRNIHNNRHIGESKVIVTFIEVV
jgi:hypothetical protein